MRSIDCAALLVWRVENTRWPVSAAVIAVCIVFQSRISPTMITSGSCRNMFFRASLKLGESVETSRWETAALPSAKRNSIGSSIVTMWTGRFSMIERMMPASVVDLPDPVGPVIEHEALGQVDEALEDLGKVQLRDRGQLEGDPPEDGREGAALDEDVAPEAGDPGQAVADVDRLVRSRRSFWAGVRMPSSISSRSLGCKASAFKGISRPLIRSKGGRMGFKWRSEASFLAMNLSNSARVNVPRL